jgi:hypothetical protein
MLSIDSSAAAITLGTTATDDVVGHCGSSTGSD